MNPFPYIFNLLETKPVCGVITWFTGWVLGSVQLTTTLNREIILWHFQLTSLFIGSIAGILTIIAMAKKLLKEKKHKTK